MLPDLGLDCEEFTPPFAGLSDEAAIEAYCGDDDGCLKRAERCRFRLECKTFGEMTHDEIVNICGAGENRDELCWMKVENCDRFANLEDRVQNLEESVKQSTGNERKHT